MGFMAPWVPQFSSALDKNPPKEPVCFSLATISTDPAGNPAPRVRTCVFRDFLFADRTTNVLTMCTDKRMEKYRELKQNNRFEACFYLHPARRQFRFSGFVKFVSSTEYPDDLEVYIPSPVYSETGAPLVSAVADEETEEEADETAKAVESQKTESDVNCDVKTDVDAENGKSAPQLSSANGRCQCGAVKTPKTPPQPQTQPQKKDTYPIYSPTLSATRGGAVDGLQKTTRTSTASSIDSFVDHMSLLDATAPTESDWKSEVARIWNSLSGPMKDSFRKPPPGTPLTNEAAQRLSSIARGVDGEAEDVGLQNFVVLLLFVDHVDEVDLTNSTGSRTEYTRFDEDQWKVRELCP